MQKYNLYIHLGSKSRETTESGLKKGQNSIFKEIENMCIIVKCW